MALASEIHRVLVPTIRQVIGEFEFAGQSTPSGAVGGDLIDVVGNDRGWIAYIADVSGHGVAPGVVMGMVKSATRMYLASGGGTGGLLESLNSVLQPIKKPEMFATFAYLAWDGQQLEYSTAGHPAILHFHAASGEFSELSCSNLPVALFAGRDFSAGSTSFAAGDLFVMLTDGLIEVANQKDEEFGLARIRSELTAHASEPPEAILSAVVDAAGRHGRVVDDLSLLLVRCRPSRLL